MKSLIQLVEDYLKIEKTDYAVLIYGGWGSGKTHFFRNELTKKIQQLEFKPVYISLNGVSSIDDISKKIFFEINPELKSKEGKRLSEIIKAAAGVIGIDTGKFTTENWLELENNFVLCFDDLERAQLNIKEVLGYVNNFVEHDNLKTIIIGNEDEILNNELMENYDRKVAAVYRNIKKDASEAEELKPEKVFSKVKELFRDTLSFPQIKEKLIGISFEYVPELESVLSNIIEAYTGNTEFQSYLIDHKKVILEIINKSKSKNIRILKHALDYFETVYKHIRKKEDILRNYGGGILISILAISYEIKLGNIKTIDFEGISSTEDLFLNLHLSSDKMKETDLSKFHNKYYRNASYSLYYRLSIFNYVSKGFFDKNLFDSEIDKDKKEIADPITALKRSLTSSKWTHYSDKEFSDRAKKLLKHIVKGEINLPLYPQLFTCYSFYSRENLIKENIGELKKLFTEGIKESFKNKRYEGQISSLPAAFEPTDDKDYVEIRDFTINHANKLEEKNMEERTIELFKLLPEKFEEFTSKVLDDQGGFYRIPIFRYADPKKLVNLIIKLKNDELADFSRIIGSRYSLPLNTSLLTQEISNLKALKKLINAYTKDKKITLSIHLLNRVSKSIEDILRKYKDKVKSQKKGGEKVNGKRNL